MNIVTAGRNYFWCITENKNKAAASLHNWQRKGVNMELELILEDMCLHYCKHAALDLSHTTLQEICDKCPLNNLIIQRRSEGDKGVHEDHVRVVHGM